MIESFSVSTSYVSGSNPNSFLYLLIESTMLSLSLIDTTYADFSLLSVELREDVNNMSSVINREYFTMITHTVHEENNVLKKRIPRSIYILILEACFYEL